MLMTKMSVPSSLDPAWALQPILVWRDESHNHSIFALAYGAVVASGFLMGLLCGWAVWG